MLEKTVACKAKIMFKCIFKSNSKLRVNLIIMLQIFSLPRGGLKIRREYHWDVPQFYLLHIHSRDVARPMACEQKYMMDFKARETLFLANC